MSQYALDPLFKQMMVTLGQMHGFVPETEVEVSRLPRKIDIVIKLPDEADRIRLAQETALIRLKAHNQIEFKGRNDPLTSAGYQLIRARTLLYMSEQKIQRSQMGVFIVCASRPKKVLYDSETVFTQIHPGYYISDEKPATVLIVVNKMAFRPEHYPLLLFASSKRKFQHLLQIILTDSSYQAYIHFAYLVRPTVTKEVFQMLAESAYITRENLEFIAQDIGHLLMPLITDKEVVYKSPFVQELLDERKMLLQKLRHRKRREQTLLEKERQALLEQERQRQQEMVAKERQALLEQERQRQQELVAKERQRLTRLLSQRFGELPETLVQRIETNNDFDQLVAWLDHSLTVSTLAEFEQLLNNH